MEVATIINQIINREPLSIEQAKFIYTQLIKGQLTDTEITILLLNGIWHNINVAELVGAALALRENSLEIDIDINNAIDCCGTGGDGAHTINLSSLASIVAVACGLKVIKHGNRGVSSISGSANFMENLGIDINMSTTKAANLFSQTDFTFLFAPLYHAGIKHAMPIRQKLKSRTIFNILGPLVNPTLVKRQLIGVYDLKLFPLFKLAIPQLNYDEVYIINGDGIDEVNLETFTSVLKINTKKTEQIELTAQDFGLTATPISAIKTTAPGYLPFSSKNILQGKAHFGINNYIAATTALMFQVAGDHRTLVELTALALVKLNSGAVYIKLQEILSLSSK